MPALVDGKTVLKYKSMTFLSLFQIVCTINSLLVNPSAPSLLAQADSVVKKKSSA